MFFRNLLVLASVILATASTAEAAKITKFVVTCIGRTEGTHDDVYLAGVRDGKAVAWGDGHQKGTSVKNSVNLSEKDADRNKLILDDKSLAELDFTNTLEISVKEKDVTVEQLIGTVTIGPTEGTKKVVLSGGTGDGKFTYQVEYTVAP